MQDDNNLVLYNKLLYPPANYRWHSGTSGQGTGTAVTIMQGDGNLVVYDQSQPPAPLWDSDTCISGSVLVMQDDGNLVIYGNGVALWSTESYYPLTVTAERPFQDVVKKKALARPRRCTETAH